MKIYKEDLIGRITNGVPLSKTMARQVIDRTLDIITQELAFGNRVEIDGFGIFEMQERAARTGRNIQTGEPVPIPARLVPHFIPSIKLTRALQQEGKHGL